MYSIIKTIYINRKINIGVPEKRKLFGERSELCEAQETRGSKFTCEFGRNSTVYCFVASGLLNSFEIHL
jgi:hypothetical protein